MDRKCAVDVLHCAVTNTAVLQAATAGEAFEAAIHAQKVGAALDSGANGDVNGGVNGVV